MLRLTAADLARIIGEIAGRTMARMLEDVRRAQIAAAKEAGEQFAMSLDRRCYGTKATDQYTLNVAREIERKCMPRKGA